MSRIPPAVIAEVDGRAGGYCEACGLPCDTPEYHHRQARGMGGSTARELDVAYNLLRLHKACHGWVHAHPTLARERGLIVPSWADPRLMLVITSPVGR